MEIVINYLIIGASLLFFLVALAEFIKTRKLVLFLFQTGGLLIFLFVLRLVTDFPDTLRIQAFGSGISVLWSILIMFVCTLLGIVCHHFYYLNRAFSWRKFLKPLLASPIIFLPLIGSVQGLPYLEDMQLISFGILAFQNGFFWKAVFEKAQPT